MSDTIRFTQGSQSFPNTSSRLAVSVAKGGNTFARTTPERSGVGIMQHTTTELADSQDYPDNGKWHTTQMVMEKQHCIFMLQATTTVNATPYANACVAVRYREDGPLLKVIFRPAPSRSAKRETHHAFVGKGDILSVEELEKLGVTPPATYIDNYFDQEEVDALFEVQKLTEGTAKPELIEVKTPDGTTAVVTGPSRKRRKVKLRRH